MKSLGNFKKPFGLAFIVIWLFSQYFGPNFVFAQATQHFSITRTAIVTVGNPPIENCPRGWPITGHVTQGPDGASSHGDSSPTPGNEALDIGTEGELHRPVYATMNGRVIVSEVVGGVLNQQIIIEPATECRHANTNNPLTWVGFMHLSARLVNVGDTVTFGQQIGESGRAGSGPHLHYQFDPTATLAEGGRQFPIEFPHIPVNVPRACNSSAECNVATTAPPSL